jgi:hypothetical protein
MPMLWRLWQIINEAVKGGESWYAAWQAIRTEVTKHWPSLTASGAAVLAFLGALREDLGWTGLIVLTVAAFASVWMIINQVMHNRHKEVKTTPFGVRFDPDQSSYAVSRLRMLCLTALDPACDALNEIINGRLAQLKLAHPETTVIFNRFIRIAGRLTEYPSRTLHLLFKEHGNNSNILKEPEVARWVRAYLDGYNEAVSLMLEAYAGEKRELVRREDYNEWRSRHARLKEKLEEMSHEKRLRDTHLIVSCVKITEIKEED